MLRVLKYLGLLVLIVLALAAGVFFTGNTVTLLAWVAGPDHGWDLSLKAPAPDYADDASWAARPGKYSLADMVPEGVDNPQGARAVDVFFVHPTGYMNGHDWNSPLNAESRTEENTKWMMANQASAYNGCCNVYALRYREASFFRYLGAPEGVGQKAMDFAYADVERAFAYYLEHDNKGKPFIIASHSQGTTHALRLIQDHVDGKDIAGRLVAAYLIGSTVTNASVDALKTVKVCSGASDTGCIVHWATFGEGGSPDPRRMTGLVCVNPLSWTRDGGRVEANSHKGGVPQSGRFSIKLWGDDAPQGMVFPNLGKPVPKATWAECRDGILYVGDQSGTAFDHMDMGGKNYHGLDYPLFHMDIRENARLRAQAYLQVALQGAATPVPAVPQ